MAPLLEYSSPRKVLLFYFVFVIFTSILSCAYSESHNHDESRMSIGSRRRMLDIDYEDEPPKKKATTMSSKDSKVIKPSLSTKNQTKVVKGNSTISSKNQTKTTYSTKEKSSGLLTKSELKKLNSTSTSKTFNSTKTSTTSSSKKSSDLLKLSSAKNKTSKAADTLLKKNVNYKVEDIEKPKKKQNTEKESQTAKKKQSSLEEDVEKPKKKSVVDEDSDKIKKKQKDGLKEEVKSPKKQGSTEKESSRKISKEPKKKQSAQPSWIDQDDDDDDIVSELRDLPIRFQQTLLPDLERISTTSRAYLNKASKEITRGVKPYVGNKYASTIASLVSFAFIFIPFILVSLVFNKFKAYFSVQKIVIFIQIYLAIYFSILGFTSLVTGLEPLKFFYSTSRSTYICLQVLQTLGYVLYLLLLLMYLILVFSTDCGLSSKVLALAQTIVGFAVGLHYYIAVFHRMVLHQPPKTNWKIHGTYALCFFSICMLSRAERRKKMYMEEDGEEGKKS